MNDEPCAMCEHDPACGYATVGEYRLCHADDHSCYMDALQAQAIAHSAHEVLAKYLGDEDR